MKRKKPHERRCSYVVILADAVASDDELRDLAAYLSNLSLSDCDVVVLDAAPPEDFARRRRNLCWVSRHMPLRDVDLVRAAADAAACEKVIVAAPGVRYSLAAIERISQLLESHEIVEPQDYFDPLPWWSGIDAGRILVHRAIEPSPDHGETFGFRRAVVRSLRFSVLGDSDPVRRLASVGAEVHGASDVFVRRKPLPLSDWLGTRARAAGNDFVLPVKTAFFFALMPLLLLLGVVGDLRLAGGYAGVIAFASVGLALRGRTGAGAFFPLRACLFAPLWVFERSLSVYWALWRKLRTESGADAVPQAGEGNAARKLGVR